MSAVAPHDEAPHDEASHDGVGTLADAAAALLAVDPAGLGGALLVGGGDVEGARWLAHHRALRGDAPMRRVPVGVTEDRLVGGLDLAATLASGTRVAIRGLLAEACGGTLVLARAADASTAVVAHLATALDEGAVRVERDGLSALHAADVAIVAQVDAAERESLAAPLADRLALVVAVPHGYAPGSRASCHDIDDARARLPRVAAREADADALCRLAERLAVTSLRPVLQALRVARAAAALAGRDVPAPADLRLATQLVLAPRARRLPDGPHDVPPPPPSDGDGETPQADVRTPEPPADGERCDDVPPDPAALQDMLVAAARTALPRELLAPPRLVPRGAQPRRQARDDGRRGVERPSTSRGRRVGARRAWPRGGQRLDLLETIRAAAPWQKVRLSALGARLSTTPGCHPERSEGSPDPAPSRRPIPEILRSLRSLRMTTEESAHSREPRAEGRAPLVIRGDDLHVRRYKRRVGTTTVFVVDASGSAAVGRLAEAKGAIELLLGESYVRRDRVALVAFRGARAEVLLPPTRALTRARRALAALPGGGGTPLAAGLLLAARLVIAARRDGADASIVLLTDGRANIALDGAPGRARARDDARAAGRALRDLGVRAVLVDTSPRGDPDARAVADAMAARHLVLPTLSAGALRDCARALMPEAGA